VADNTGILELGVESWPLLLLLRDLRRREEVEVERVEESRRLSRKALMVKVVRELVVGVKAVGARQLLSGNLFLKKASNGSFSAPFLAAGNYR